LDCTELPPYADAIRAATGLPVWDAITGCDFYINALKDNPRFGVNDWQNSFEANQEVKAPSNDDITKVKEKLKTKQNPILGVIRLDYNYPPNDGDVDCPASYGYQILYRMVPGLTFEMAQAGEMTEDVKKDFQIAVKWLESHGACGITGDCGFMMAFQLLARDVATVPVFMSSMVQCPMVELAYDEFDKILIITANENSLEPQKKILLSHCGFDVEDDRFIIIGAQDVPGFDVIFKGGKVPVEVVTPGIVKMCKDTLNKIPSIRAIILECTELPPYADAIRQATGLPVWDAITNADFFISAFQDNPRFGLNEWQMPWDGMIQEYTLGENLTEAEKGKSVTLP
jgi:hypothetical protein